MTTIYKSIIRPKYEIEESMRAIYTLSTADEKLVAEFIDLAKSRAELAAKLALANAQMICSNGNSIAYNLELYRSYKTLLNASEKVSFPPASLVMLGQKADDIKRIIRDANNQETELC